MEPRGVTLKTAGELLGGDKPFAVRTVSAMISRGELEAYGERKKRRVTLRSIRAYQEVRSWRDVNEHDAREEAATPSRRKTGHGSRSFRNDLPDTMYAEVSIGARTPKRGSTRS
jgi:hypothetical protein